MSSLAGAARPPLEKAPCSTYPRLIWVNTWYLGDLRTPFGGMKRSGIGREGGRWSFDFYAEPKNICLRLR